MLTSQTKSDGSSGGSPLSPASDLSDSHFFSPSLFFPGDDNTTYYGRHAFPDALDQVPDDYYAVLMSPVAAPLAGFSSSLQNNVPGFEPLDENMVTDANQSYSRGLLGQHHSHNEESIERETSSSPSKTPRSSDSKARRSVKADDTDASAGPGRAKLCISQRPKRASASRKKPSRPGDTEKKQQARASHNQIERKYRNRLNDQFERLLTALASTATKDGDFVDDEDRSRTLSKGNVLELARRRLWTLEKENQSLSNEVEELRSILRAGHLAGTARLGRA